MRVVRLKNWSVIVFVIVVAGFRVRRVIRERMFLVR